jgi:hypothetical protein
MHKNKNITLLPLSLVGVRKHFKECAENNMEQPTTSDSSVDKCEGLKLKGGAFIATTPAAAELCENHDAPCYTMLSQDVCVFDATIACMHSAVPNLLQDVDDGVESRTTQIEEGEDDEDIATLDALTLHPFPGYKSSQSQLPCLVRI